MESNAMKPTGFKAEDFVYDSSLISFAEEPLPEPIYPKRAEPIEEESFTYERTKLGIIKPVPTARTMMKRLGVK